MDLKIFEKENELRSAPEKVTNEELKVWNPNMERVVIPKDDKGILVQPSGKIQDDQQTFIDPKDFNKKFHDLTGGLLSYVNWSNLVVAGGCISNTINAVCSNRMVTDVDLFVYGLSETDAKSKVDEVVKAVSSYCEDRYQSNLHILINKYVVSLIPDSKRELKVQIILRAYKNIYEVLAGFDVDSCAVAYDGRDVLLTNRSENAFRTRYNVVDISRRSPSYESRLYKYWKRGFGIYIPFEYTDNNKMYFMNSSSLGLDKLMYLISCSRQSKVNRFLNIMTQRINRRVSRSSVSNYDEKELVFEKGDIRNTVIHYNKTVSPEFRYKVYNKYSRIVDKVKFITQDPGQQLTGSFNPITSTDWINVDYLNESIDFIGRPKTLLKIKSGQLVDFVNSQDKDVAVKDNSFFNMLCYMIMYTPNEDYLMNAFDKIQMFPANRNLYKIDYIELVLLMNRQKLLKYLFEKNKEKRTYATKVVLMIQIAIMLDNTDLLQIINEFYPFNIHNYQEIIRKFNSLSVANYYCLRIDNFKRLSTIEQVKNMDDEKKVSFLHNLWHKWGYYWNNVDLKNAYEIVDYQQVPIDIIRMLNHLEHENRDSLYKKCVDDLKHKVEIKKPNPYSEGSFEHMWYEYLLKRTVDREINKPEDRHIFASQILKELYSKTEDDIKKLITEDFKDPIHRINPFILFIMKAVFHQEFDNLSEFKTLFRDKPEYDPLVDLLVYLDDLDTLTKVVKEKNVEKFLKDKRNLINSKLLKHIEELEKQKFQMSKDNLFNKFEKLFYNTEYHLQAYNSGVLHKGYVRVENIFGYTPDDYIINKLLYFYNIVFNHKKSVEDDDLVTLSNLRKSLVKIDLNKPLVTVDRKQCLDDNIEDVLNRLE